MSGSLDSARDDGQLQQLQTRQILRIHYPDRRVVIVNNNQIVDAMALQQIKNFHGQFVLMHAYRI